MAELEVKSMETTPSSQEGQKKEDKSLGSSGKSSKSKLPSGPLFTLKKWNAVAMWQWDVECDTCAICRVQVMGELVCIKSYGCILHNNGGDNYYRSF